MAAAIAVALGGLLGMALLPVTAPDPAFSARLEAWRALPPTSRPSRP